MSLAQIHSKAIAEVHAREGKLTFVRHRSNESYLNSMTNYGCAIGTLVGSVLK
jgi:hypothetical protein